MKSKSWIQKGYQILSGAEVCLGSCGLSKIAENIFSGLGKGVFTIGLSEIKAPGTPASESETLRVLQSALSDTLPSGVGGNLLGLQSKVLGSP